MIEKMNELITLQKNTVTVDKYGNHKNTWEDYYTCHAYANTFVKEETESEVSADERSITFEVRYCSELKGVTSTGYRIIFHDEAYNIESVDMMNWQRKFIHLKCRKEKR